MTPIASLVMAAGLPWAVVGSPRTLAPGVPFTGSLSAGAAEAFEVDLDAGALLEALVEQQGVDVAIDVTAPGAEPVRNIDYRNEPTRTERVLWIAGASGPQGLTAAAPKGPLPAIGRSARLRRLGPTPAPQHERHRAHQGDALRRHRQRGGAGAQVLREGVRRRGGARPGHQRGG